MGPRPKGEPAALEAVSAQLASQADRLEAVAAGVPTLLPLPAFIGPGRAAHDSEFQQASAQAKAAAHTLSLEAKLLAAEAGALAQRQREWDVRDNARKQAEQAARHRAARDHP